MWFCFLPPLSCAEMLTLDIIQKFYRSLTRTFTNAGNLFPKLLSRSAVELKSLNSLICWQVGEIKLTGLQNMLKIKARSELGPVFWAQQTWMAPLKESYPRGLSNFMLVKSKNHNLTFGNRFCMCLTVFGWGK